MRFRARCRLMALPALVLSAYLAVAANAQTLYTATARAYISPSEVVGRLYVVDPDTAGAKLVGPLRLEDGRYVGVNGLAVHPRTRALYGITAGVTPSLRPSLVRIEPKTAEATLIGQLGHSASDINFNADGQLFIWLTDLSQLGTVDLKSGAATPVGSTSIPGATGGGLAINQKGVAYIATTTAVGTLDTVDIVSGTRTVGPSLSGAPYLSAIHALTFSPSGTLYGVNTNLAAPAKTVLVMVDPTLGVVSPIGALPEDANALTFSPDAVALAGEAKPKYLGYAAIGGLLLVLAVAVGMLLRLWVRRSR